MMDSSLKVLLPSPARLSTGLRMSCSKGRRTKMTDETREVVPVWTLATGDMLSPVVAMDGSMTAERLAELRNVLVAFATANRSPRSRYTRYPPRSTFPAVSLSTLQSPLAQHSTQLISKSGGAPPAVVSSVTNGEALYRMVVPAKMAAGFNKGLIRPMKSKGVAGGVCSAFVNSSSDIVGAAHLCFLVRGDSYCDRGSCSSGRRGGRRECGPHSCCSTVLMAVAVGASAAAEHQRQGGNLRTLPSYSSSSTNRSSMMNQWSPMGAATQSTRRPLWYSMKESWGASLGLDSAVHALGKAIAAAERRLARWQMALDGLPNLGAVDVETLADSFPGIDEGGGGVSKHLELAACHCAEAARDRPPGCGACGSNSWQHVGELLSLAYCRPISFVNKLESDIEDVLIRLSTLEIARPRGLRSPVVASKEVDRRLRTAYRLLRICRSSAGQGPSYGRRD